MVEIGRCKDCRYWDDFDADEDGFGICNQLLSNKNDLVRFSRSTFFPEGRPSKRVETSFSLTTSPDFGCNAFKQEEEEPKEGRPKGKQRKVCPICGGTKVQWSKDIGVAEDCSNCEGLGYVYE